MRISDWSSDVCSSDLLFDAAPRLYQSDKALPLADLVGPNPREIFEHRRFQRIGIIAFVENGAGDGLHRPTLARNGIDGGKAPTSPHNLNMAFGPAELGRACCRETVGESG